MKFIRLKFIIFIIKIVFYKLRYKNSFIIQSYKIGFENSCKLIIQNNGKIQFGNMNYFTRFTNIEAYGAEIYFGNNISFNKNCNIVARSKISIGDNCIFGPNVCIYDHNYCMRLCEDPFSKQGYVSKEIIVGNNVWIGANTSINAGAIIEDNVVVGANSVVTGTLKSNAIYAGVPTKEIKKIK